MSGHKHMRLYVRKYGMYCMDVLEQLCEVLRPGFAMCSLFCATISLTVIYNVHVLAKPP